MKTKIIFVRIASMNYYKGITEKDKPQNGGSYVTDTGLAHECYNFDAVTYEDGTQECLGFAMLTGAGKTTQIKLENIAGCDLLENEAELSGVTVVWCAKSHNCKNIRVVGFYKNATVYRNSQFAEFDSGYVQQFNFTAAKKDCVLLPYQERFSNSKWYVPTSGNNNYKFGFGRSCIWYGGSKTKDKNEIEFVEKMIESIETYDGENWIDKGGETNEF